MSVTPLGRLPVAGLSCWHSWRSPRLTPCQCPSSRRGCSATEQDATASELRILISRLRRDLRRLSTAATIAHTARGYALVGADIDVIDFERLLVEAIAAEADTPAVAAVLAEAAGAQCRGDIGAPELGGHPAATRLTRRHWKIAFGERDAADSAFTLARWSDILRVVGHRDAALGRPGCHVRGRGTGCTWG